MATDAIATGARLPPGWRLPLLALAVVSMAAAILAGLARLGLVPAVLAGAGASAAHGALFVCGFFGTVIALERAVALDSGLLHVGALASGGGGALLVAGGPVPVAIGLFGFAWVLYAAGTWKVVRLRTGPDTLTLLTGALAWGGGIAAWAAGCAWTAITPWWIAFLVLTIAAERLELTRLLPPSPRMRVVFVVLVLGLAVGAIGTTFGFATAGARTTGLALVGFAAWLVANDIARRNAGREGLTGYIARVLLAGYAWLAVGGMATLANGSGGASVLHDTALHAILVGFVFSMVFAHAPIIVPAVTRTAVAFSAWFYLPVILLQVAVALRALGDLSGQAELRRAGAAASALAIVFFIGTLVTAIGTARRSRLRVAATSAATAPAGPTGLTAPTVRLPPDTGR